MQAGQQTQGAHKQPRPRQGSQARQGPQSKPASASGSLPVPVLMALDTALELPEVRALGSTVWPVASEMALATACNEQEETNGQDMVWRGVGQGSRDNTRGRRNGARDGLEEGRGRRSEQAK